MKKLYIIITTILIALTSFQINAEKWYDMSEFEVLGTLVPDASAPYSRLPDEMKGQVKDQLWQLGLNSAGLSIRFASDASDIYAKWTSLNKFAMNHMTQIGVRGMDLYMLMPDETWVYVGSARPSTEETTKKATIIKGLPKMMREYMLFLPLYDGIRDLSIGINDGAKLIEPDVDLPSPDLPIVMYGTSIMQGGCATRPGMAHTNIIQRKLNREVVNLGFSGSAHLEPEIAHLMADSEAAVYVIDVLPNNTVSSLKEKLEPFYRIIRAKRPTTPIILVENPVYIRQHYDKGYKQGIDNLNNTLRQFYDKMLEEKDFNLYYFEGTDVLGNEYEGTVDGVHLTDLGFQHFADAMIPLLETVINE